MFCTGTVPSAGYTTQPLQLLYRGLASERYRQPVAVRAKRNRSRFCIRVKLYNGRIVSGGRYNRLELRIQVSIR
jgi:hypothetical protein